jgi:hypothetical protein
MQRMQQKLSEDACGDQCTSATIYYNGADRVQHSPLSSRSLVCVYYSLWAGCWVATVAEHDDCFAFLRVSRLSHNEQQWPLFNSPS